LTIKSTSHTTPPRQVPPTDRPCRRYYSISLSATGSLLAPLLPRTRRNRSPTSTKLVFCMPVKYSVVKDLDCLGNQFSGQAEQTAENSLRPQMDADKRRSVNWFSPAFICVHLRLYNLKSRPVGCSGP